MKKVIKRILCIGLLGILLVATLLIGINVIVIQSTRDQIVQADEVEAIDCILILGARVYSSGQPSDILKDRLLAGYSVYTQDPTRKFLLSGDHGQTNYDEVNGMRTFLEEKGVPSEVLFLDHAGFSTYESLYRAEYIFGAKKIAIVTQAYHLPRALYIANQLGLEAVGIEADVSPYINMTQFKIREMLARVKDFGFVHFLMPKPTYLGPTISLEESAAVTHDKQ